MIPIGRRAAQRAFSPHHPEAFGFGRVAPAIRLEHRVDLFLQAAEAIGAIAEHVVQRQHNNAGAA